MLATKARTVEPAATGAPSNPSTIDRADVRAPAQSVGVRVQIEGLRKAFTNDCEKRQT